MALDLIEGFENGNYNNWTVVDTAGGTIQIQSTIVKSGNYALAMTTNGNNDNSNIILARPIEGGLVDGYTFSCWVRVSATGWWQEGSLWLIDTIGGGWVLIEFSGSDIIYNGDNIPATTLVANASANTWYKFEIVWHDNNTIDFRVKDETNSTLGEALGINAATTYNFDEIRLRTQDDSSAVGSYTAYFDDVVYGHEMPTEIKFTKHNIQPRKFVGRYPNNPITDLTGYDWMHTFLIEDGIYYEYMGIGSGTTYQTTLMIGDCHLNLYNYGPVTNLEQVITKIKTIDGIKTCVTWYRYTGCNLYVSDTVNNFYDYGTIYNDSTLGYTGQVLHPHFIIIDGVVYHDSVDQGDHIAGAVITEYIHEPKIIYDNIMSALASWESGQITNIHIFIIDGEIFILYSAGSAGDDRDLGIRWCEYYSEFNNNYLDSPRLNAGTQLWEGSYINIGEIDLDGIMLYFGLGSTGCGLLRWDYIDWSQPTMSIWAIKTIGGVLI